VHRFTTCRHPHSVRVPRSSYWSPRPRTCSETRQASPAQDRRSPDLPHAHSMGGLIVRCMVQRIIPNDPDAGGHLDSGADYVERISPMPPHTAASSSRSVVCWRRSATHRGPGRRHLRYGMVNSEEGYQNLRRFLFGNLRVQVELVGLDVQGREDDYHLATGGVPGDPRSARSRARVLHRPSRTKRGLAKYPSQLRFRSP
jgi:hypothetical protein